MQGIPRTYDLVCVVCENSFLHTCKTAKVCSEPCRKERQKQRYGKGALVNPFLPTGTVAAMAALQVSVDLLKKGYAVFRSVSPACFCDVIAIKEEEIMRVEVRTGYTSPVSGKQVYPKVTKGNITHYAVWDRNTERITYIPYRRVF